MAIILSIVALAIAAAGGFGILALVCRPPSFSRAEVCGAAIVLGCGVVTISSFLFGLLVDGWVLRLAVSAICIGSVILARLRQPSTFAGYRPIPFAGSTALTWIVAAAALSLVTWVSLYHKDLGWDGMFNWEAKSRAAFLSHGAFPLRAFASGLSHSRYPLLVPLLGAWIYDWLGRIDQSMLKLVGPFFYLGALLLLTGAAQRLTNNRFSGVLAVLLLLSVPHVIIGNGGAASGYADWPIAVSYLCALIAANEYTRTGSPEAGRLAGVVLVLGIWTKSDMIVLLVCLAVVIAPRVVQERDWKNALVILLPGLSVRVLWSVLMGWVNASPEGDFHFRAHFERILLLPQCLLQEAAKWKSWSLFWPLLLLTMALVVTPRRLRRVTPWVSGVCLPLLLYTFVFIFSAWNPVEDHVYSALPRLLLQVVPAGALFIVVALSMMFESAPEIAAAPGAVQAAPLDRGETSIDAAAAILATGGVTLQDGREPFRQKNARPTGKKKTHRATR